MNKPHEITERERAALIRAEAASLHAEKAKRRIGHLQDLTEALATAGTPTQIAEAVLEQGVALFGMLTATIYVRAPNGKDAFVLASHGLPAELFEGFRTIPLSVSLPITDAIRRNEPVIFRTPDEIFAAYPHLRAPASGEFSFKSAIAIPLRSSTEAMGSIGLSFPEARGFEDEEVAFLTAVARQCGQALERAQLLELERRRASRSAFLADATLTLTNAHDPEEVLRELCRLAVPRLGDWCAIEWVVGDTTEQLAVAHVDPKKVDLARGLRVKYPPDRSQKAGVYEVIRTGKPELIPDIPRQLLLDAARDEEQRGMIDDLDIRSALIVPIVAIGKPLGALSLVRGISNRAYDEDDLRFVLRPPLAG